MKFQHNKDKLIASLLYLSKKATAFDQYKACKLIFLADKRHLVEFGRSITGDSFVAMKYGPVPSNAREEITDLLKDKGSLVEFFSLDRVYKNPRLVAKSDPDFSVLSKSDISALDDTLSTYGSKGFDELYAITHEMIAYKKAWKDDDSQKAFPMNVEDFFEQDENAIEGVLEEMQENIHLQTAFR